MLSGIAANESFPEIATMRGVQSIVAESGIETTSASTRGTANLDVIKAVNRGEITTIANVASTESAKPASPP